MSYIVAVVDQNTVRTYRDEADAPPGSVTFANPEELSLALAKGAMDTIRGMLLGEEVEWSSSTIDAARKLWYVLGIGAEIAIDWGSKGYSKMKDGFGNVKTQDHARIELIQLAWSPLCRDPMISYFHKKLPPQARKIAAILHDDGRRIWTNEQAEATISARGSEIVTQRDALTTFRYYKSQFFQWKILKRVTYGEFLAKAEFSGMVLQGEGDSAEDHI